MSGELKVNAEINFSPNRFKQGLSSLDSSLDKTGTKGKQAFDKVGQAATQAKPALNSFKQSADQVTQSTTRMGQSAGATTLSMIGLTQQATAAISTWQSLDKTLIAIEKIHFDVAKAVEDVTRKERELNEMLARGEERTQSYIDKTKDLEFVRTDLLIKTKELRAEEDAYNTSLINFALQMSTTAFFGISTLNAVLGKNVFAWGAATLAARGFTLANIKAALSVKGVTAAMTLMAAHPLILIVLAAATVAITAYDQNWLGVRDTLGGLVGTELPSITEALTGMSEDILPEANAETMMLSNNMVELAAATGETSNVTSAYDLILGQLNITTDEGTKNNKKLSGSLSGVSNWYKTITSEADSYNKALTKSVRIGDEWIKMQEKVSRFNQKKTNGLVKDDDPLFGQNGIFDSEGNRIGASNFGAGLAVGGFGRGTTLSFRQDPSRLGQKSGSARNRAGGHSQFRRDRFNPRNLIPEFAEAHNISEIGLQFMWFEWGRTGGIGIKGGGNAETATKGLNNAMRGVQEKVIMQDKRFTELLRINPFVEVTLESFLNVEPLLKQAQNFTEIARINNLSSFDVIENIGVLGSLKKSVQFLGSSQNIQNNLGVLSDESIELFTLHGPNKAQHAKILSDQLSYMNIERFAAVGT